MYNLAHSDTADSAHTWQRSLVAEGSFLWERLDAAKRSARATSGVKSGSSTAQYVESQLARWSQVVARGDRAGLVRRLEWDDVSLNELSQAISAVENPPGSRLPAWVETVNLIVQAALAAAAANDQKIPANWLSTVPFVHLLMPVLSVARQALQNRGIHSAALSPQAIESLERNLLARLMRVSADTLFEEFSRAGDARNYQRFVDHHLSDGLVSLFGTYPVLARLFAVTTTHWVDATLEFIERLHRDLPELCVLFGQTEQVAALEAGLSDLHHGGRSVLVLTFPGGQKLVYKPKDVGLESWFSDFLSWCSRRDRQLDLRALRVLNRGSYGWVEFAEHQPCADSSAARRFYTRAGMLLAFVHALRGTDCHNENLVASGEHLVLIDVETLFHHEARTMEGLNDAEATDNAATQQYWRSVLRTGLLPRWNFSSDNRSFYDVSGLGSGAQSAQRVTVWRWRAVNTDQMEILSELKAPHQEKSAPRMGDSVLSPQDYQAQIASGFRHAYRFLLAHRSELQGTDAPLARLESIWTRFVFRPTRIYATILQRAMQPHCLRDGVAFSLELEYLACAFLANRTRPAAWPILEAERRAMEQLDVPFFGGRALDDALYTDGKLLVPSYFERASAADVSDLLSVLSEADLTAQIAMIEGCFLAVRAQGSAHVPHREPFMPLPAPSPAELIARAERLGAEILARSIPDADGGLGWIGLRHVFEAERVQLQVLGNNLYDGRGGIAVFLAALYRITGRAEYRDQALRTLSPLQRQLRTQDAAARGRFARLNGIGGAGGVGSLIYSFAKLHQLTRDDALLADVRLLADGIAPEIIAADTKLDVMSGAAGAILGLLSLGRGEKALIETAARCGDHLVARLVGEQGARAWSTLVRRPLTGFSHGAAGIAYSLVKLYEATGNASYREAAFEGMAYERSTYAPAERNWPDFREFDDTGAASFLTRWCHGAPGVALARMGGLSTARTGETLADIGIALRTTSEFPMDSVDTLCCGNFGRIDILLTGAQTLEQPEWRAIALRNAANVLARADRNGAFRLFPNLSESVFDPGFFRGTAGIGYSLLRLASNDLPSVLLWS